MYLIRHSERLDSVDWNKWTKSKRYQENPYDTPITKNGYNIAKQTILDILKNDDHEMGNIYSSPAERCIQTALEFQKQIYKKYKKLIPIKVEYGLIYFNIGPVNALTKYKYEDNKVIFDNSESFLIDKHMSLKDISKRYGIEKFDMDYKSICSIEKVNSEFVNTEKSLNRIISTIIGLYKNIDNKNFLFILASSNADMVLKQYNNNN